MMECSRLPMQDALEVRAVGVVATLHELCRLGGRGHCGHSRLLGFHGQCR